MADRLYLSSHLPEPVLVVGSVAYDGITTPHRSVDRVLGGAASYASVAASFFAPVRLVGVVGKDFDPADRARFERRGIDMRGLQAVAEGNTFFWRGRYLPGFHQRETLETQLNVFAEFHPHLPVDYPSSPYICLGNIGPDLQHIVLDQITGKPFVLADTMNFWISSQKPALIDLLRRINCFVINDEEATELTGEANLYLAGKALQQLSPPIVIIKKGEHGALLFHQEHLFVLPAYPVLNLEDPTGAGDTFAGALIGALAALGKTDFVSFKRALLYATAAASLTVEAFSIEGLERGKAPEIARRVDTLKRMITLH